MPFGDYFFAEWETKFFLASSMNSRKPFCSLVSFDDFFFFLETGSEFFISSKLSYRSSVAMCFVFKMRAENEEDNRFVSPR